MLDFIEQDLYLTCPLKSSADMPTVSDSHLDTKYWIEEYPGNHSHGNPWFVFTNVRDSLTEGGWLTISIPYHAGTNSYYNQIGNGCPGYTDMIEHTAAWHEWLNYPKSHRQTYVRQFRKNKETKHLNKSFATMIFEQQLATIKAAETVSCIPRCKVGTAPATIHNEQETETMIANTSEDTARKYLRDRANSLNYAKDDEEDTHFNLRDPEPPKDYEEALERMNSGKVTVRPKDQRKSYHSWHDHFTWRDPAKPADHVGKEKAVEKRRHDYQHLNDAIMVKAPADAVKDLHAFESKTFH